MKQTRDILKTYFETGDFPTEVQFAEFIDSYAHLNEFNFGLSVKPTAISEQKNYHFYLANDIQFSAAGHKNVEAPLGSTLDTINGYTHVLSRNIYYKTLDVKLIGDIDIVKHQPKIIVERYKQRKSLPSGYKKPAGYYKEELRDAEFWDRKSEYVVTANQMILDLKPINYFKPGVDADYKKFSPSGSFKRGGSFRYSRHQKPFVPIRLKLQITIDEINYQSRPVDLKIVLGTSGDFDAINYNL